jgi:ketosteroid isomerase-like protein
MVDAFEFVVVNYQLHESENLITMRANIRVTSRKSGRSVESTLVELYQIRDGKIIDIDVFYKDAMEIFLLAEGK